MMEKLIKKLNNRKGFTLIELIVVIAIIGILAAILIPQFTGFTDKAKATQAMVSAKQVATAIDAIQAEGTNLTLNGVSVMSGVSNGAIEGGNITLKVASSGAFSVKFEPDSGSDAYAGRTTATGKVKALTSAEHDAI